MQTFDVSFQLIHRGCAQQSAGNKRLTAYKRERHLSRVQAMTSGDINIRRDGFLRLLTAIAGEPTKERITCASGFCTIEIFPGQRAETQARIGQQFDPFILADFCQTYFKTAV